MDRREALRTLALLGAALGGLGCARPVTKPRVLEALVIDDAVAPTATLKAAAAALERALAELSVEPQAAQLDAARGALVDALLALQPLQTFPFGTSLDVNLRTRAGYWPVRPRIIDALVDSGDEISKRTVAELGLDLKGLFALEHLLFSRARAEAPVLAPRALGLALELGRDVRAHVDRAADALGDGVSTAAKFAEAGQSSLNLVVNQLVATLESAVGRLDRALLLGQRRAPDVNELQGGPSGTSTRVIAAWLDAAARVYDGASGPGLGALCEQAAPSVHAHMRAAFDAAKAALGGLGSPLERLVTVRATDVRAAAQALRAVELALKTELAGALGVTLTFLASDGD